jgi:hypothetical protein
LCLECSGAIVAYLQSRREVLAPLEPVDVGGLNH